LPACDKNAPFILIKHLCQKSSSAQTRWKSSTESKWARSQIWEICSTDYKWTGFYT